MKIKIAVAIAVSVLAVFLSNIAIFLLDQSKYPRIMSSVVLNSFFYQDPSGFLQVFDEKAFALLNKPAQDLITTNDMQVLPATDSLKVALDKKGNPDKTEVYDITLARYPLLCTIRNSSWRGKSNKMEINSGYLYLFTRWIELPMFSSSKTE